MEEFEGGLEKRRKKEKSDKTDVKIPLRSSNDRKKSSKTGKNFRGGGGEFFCLAKIYIPACNWMLNRGWGWSGAEAEPEAARGRPQGRRLPLPLYHRVRKINQPKIT